MNLRRRILPAPLVAALVLWSLSLPAVAQQAAQDDPRLAVQGSYLRKSITTLDSVWVQDRAIDRRLPFDFGLFDRMVSFYVRIPRFDYTELDPSLTDEFRRQANALPDITADALAAVIERTLAADLVRVLNDPEVQQVRREAFFEEADLQRFAARKAQSFGLTAEQLTLLLNSSYFYLPYLSELTAWRDDNTIRVAMTGGIVWYRLRVDADSGATSVDLLAAEQTSTSAASDLTRAGSRIFMFDDVVRGVSPLEHGVLNASQALARNLGTLTKTLEDFQLSAQVVEAVGRNYRFPLGNREGVRLDDGFFLVEVEERRDGSLQQRRVGYVRVTDPADNDSDPNALSHAVQMTGRPQGVGVMLRENPLSGVDLRLRPHYQLGLSIPPAMTAVPGVTGNVLAAEATSALGINLVLAYNLAPLTGVSQLFLNADATASILEAPISGNANLTPLLVASYLTLTKKLWAGPFNLQLTAGPGVDWLELRGRYFGQELIWSRRKLGLKAEVDFEWMMVPNVHLNVGAGYKVDVLSLGSRFEYAGGALAFSAPSNTRMDLGGVSVRAGINVQLQQLPFNVFGFLDPLAAR